MASGAVLTVEIDRLSPEGDGIARLSDGREVAVPRVIPGERVAVRLQRSRQGGLEGDLLEVITPSPHRVTPRCRHFGPCGGCAWQHVDYPEQLRLKQDQLQRLLAQSMGRAAPRVSPTVPSPVAPGERMPWGYRNKVSFVFAPGDPRQGLVMGHFRRASRRVLPIEECPVHAEAGNRLAFTLRDVLRGARIPGATPDAATGIARHIVVRVAEGTGDWLATLVVTENVKALRRVTSQFLSETAKGEEREGTPGPSARNGFHLNIHDRDDPFLFGRRAMRLAGASEIREQVAGVTFLLAPTAFFQTNVRIAAAMAQLVIEDLPSSSFPRVLDLYSGVGLFALPLAARGAHVTAVEENRDAVAAAEAARRFNRVPAGRLELVAGRVEEMLSRVATRGKADEPFDAVVIDPPRQGCPPSVLDWIVNRISPRRIVYVSCNPAALAGDLAAASRAGYRADEVRPFDMFPHTAHIESIALLAR